MKKKKTNKNKQKRTKSKQTNIKNIPKEKLSYKNIMGKIVNHKLANLILTLLLPIFFVLGTFAIMLTIGEDVKDSNILITYIPFFIWLLACLFYYVFLVIVSIKQIKRNIHKIMGIVSLGQLIIYVFSAIHMVSFMIEKL